MYRILAFILAAVLSMGALQSTRAQTPTVKAATHDEIKRAIAEQGAKVTVVNFWATWCVPCIEEFPDLLQLERDFSDRGVDVMFVSADFPEDEPAVRDFLAERKVTQTTYLKKGNTTEFVNAFHSEWTGAIPATFIYDAEGQLVEFIRGKTSYEALEQRVTKLL